MDLTGTWTAPELTAELAIDGARVTGAFVLQGLRLPVTAQLQGDAAVGSFDAGDGAQFAFVARRAGDELVIESDGVAYHLRRATPARVNPLLAAKTRAAVSSPAPAAERGQRYVHPTGGELTLPPGWQVTQSPQMGLQLVPPAVAYTAQGPAELYLVSAQPAPGLTRVDDPNVVAYVDQSLRQLIPALSAPSAPVPCGPGIAIRWTASNPQTGAAILAVALLQLASGAVAGIIALGEQPRVEARLPALETIFASFRKGEGRRDPALVGVWHYWAFKATGNVSSETRKTMQLAPDGTCAERSGHEGIGNFTGKDGAGNTAWTAGYGAQSSDGRTGTWTAGDGMIYIQWQDGTGLSWQYQLSGNPGSRRLMVQAPGAREPLEWNERAVVV